MKLFTQTPAEEEAAALIASLSKRGITLRVQQQTIKWSMRFVGGLSTAELEALRRLKRELKAQIIERDAVRQKRREDQILFAPAWTRLDVGDHVQRIGAGQRGKTGTVVAIVPPLGPDGMTRHVLVRWPKGLRTGQVWPTDCLVSVDEREDA